MRIFHMFGWFYWCRENQTESQIWRKRRKEEGREEEKDYESSRGWLDGVGKDPSKAWVENLKIKGNVKSSLKVIKTRLVCKDRRIWSDAVNGLI